MPSLASIHSRHAGSECIGIVHEPIDKTLGDIIRAGRGVPDDGHSDGGQGIDSGREHLGSAPARAEAQ